MKTPWGSGIQTPSYILSPLDSGPQKFFWFRMPNFFFSFPSFRGIRKHRRETGGVFLFFTVFINYKNGAKKNRSDPRPVYVFSQKLFCRNNFIYGYSKYNILPRQFRNIVFRECNIDITRFALFHAN